MPEFTMLCALLTATIAKAGEVVECNNYGAVVTITDGADLYLGINCDTARKEGGVGKWWSAESFLDVEMDSK